MFIGDGILLTVVGIGTIILRMFDGVIKTIEYQYVPYMKRNLIFLPSLDLKVINFMQNDALKVCKGFKVLIKGNLKSRFYVLQGSVVSGETGITFQSNNQNQL